MSEILPATPAILCGAPYFMKSWTEDLEEWASLPHDDLAAILAGVRDPAEQAGIQECLAILSDACRLAVTFVGDTLEKLYVRVNAARWSLATEDALLRIALYGAEARSRRLLSALSLRVGRDVLAQPMQPDLVLCWAGLHVMQRSKRFDFLGHGMTVAQRAREGGLLLMRQHGIPAPLRDEDVAGDAYVATAADIAALLKEEDPATIPGAVVVPAPDGKTAISDLKPSRTRERQQRFSDIAGQALPLVQAPDPHEVRAGLVSRWPHAVGIIDTVLRDVSRRGPARLRNTLLVGSPGSGKSALCTAIADALGLPSLLYPCGGSADASLAGTSAQWSTARESVVLRTIRQHRVANPVLVLDEVEKTGTGRENGSLLDALLSLTEPSTARRFLDPMLEVETDLSHVSWLATSNDATKVPAPLRDRFRILRMPDPGVEHLHALLPGILADIAAETDGEAWAQALAGDEIAAIARAWEGGSLRRLRRIVEVVVVMRDSHAPRH